MKAAISAQDYFAGPTVLTKALRPDDSRFRVEYSSDQFEKPIREDEATRLY